MSSATIVGIPVPNFTAESQLGQIALHDYISGSWTCIITHASGFDAVHSTELGKITALKEEFDQRNCKIIAIAVGSQEEHDDWIHDVTETEEADVNFPIIADDTAEISRMFGMVHPDAPEGSALEYVLPFGTVVLIDTNRMVQMQTTYPISTGRNFYEVLRCLDALQLTQHSQVNTPANWEVGEDVFIATKVHTDDADDIFEKGFHEILPWFRITPQPDPPGGMRDD